MTCSVVGPSPGLRRIPTRIVVSLRGEQDLSTAPSLVTSLARAEASGHADISVDLAEVMFVDGAIIGVLHRARKDLRTRGRDLTLRGPSTFMRRVLELCGLAGLIEPVPAVAARDRRRTCTTVDRASPSKTPSTGCWRRVIPTLTASHNR